MTQPSLTVVMPAYNEEGSIEAAADEVCRCVLDNVPESSLLVIDDGSKDRTGAILNALVARDQRIGVLHQPNGGHGAAVMNGLNHATSTFVFLVDSDQQIPLDRFLEAWGLAQSGKDGVFGVRRRRNDPRLRLILTAVVRRSLRVLFGVSLFDANVPYKLVRRSAWERAKPVIPAGTLTPSLFLGVYMKARGMSIAEVDVSHRERQTGQVSIKRWKLLEFCGVAFRQLMQFRARLRSP